MCCCILVSEVRLCTDSSITCLSSFFLGPCWQEAGSVELSTVVKRWNPIGLRAPALMDTGPDQGTTLAFGFGHEMGLRWDEMGHRKARRSGLPADRRRAERTTGA